MSSGSLTIVGTGISVGQLTTEANALLASADKVLYCVADAATERLILKLSPSAESLFKFYGEGKRRIETYKEMIDRTMGFVRQGKVVCVAYYGHPGIFVYPAHTSIKVAREEGYPARMLPAISCIDCLFCDLGIDPARGCQIFEATDLTIRKRAIDTCGHVIILQASALGDLEYSFNGYETRKLRKHLPSLGEYLSKYYPLEFEIKIYNAAQFSCCDPEIRDIKIQDLLTEEISGIGTLYIPPLESAPVHLEMLDTYDMRSLLDGWRLVPLNSRPDDTAETLSNGSGK